jgi:hypothetical protein
MDSAVLRLAQRNESAILRGLRDVTQSRVAELMGLSQSVLSDFKTHIPRMAAMLAASGLRVVPCTAQQFDEGYISALKTLAAAGLRGDNGISEEDDR